MPGSSLDMAFMGAFATNITYDITEYTSIEFIGIVDVDQGDDYYLQPQLIRQVTDSFEVAVGLDVIGGPEDTFLGQFKDNDRVFFKLKYAF